VTSQWARGIELLEPIREDHQWQARQAQAQRRAHGQAQGPAEQGYGLASFKIDWEHKRVTCPQGKPSRYWKPGQDICGRATVKAVFHTSDCEGCFVRSLCTHSEKGPRSITFRERAEHEALQEVRQRQRTAEFKTAINVRAGVEGTMSQGVRSFELRQTRYHPEGTRVGSHTSAAHPDRCSYEYRTIDCLVAGHEAFPHPNFALRGTGSGLGCSLSPTHSSIGRRCQCWVRALKTSKSFISCLYISSPAQNPGSHAHNTIVGRDSQRC